MSLSFKTINLVSPTYPTTTLEQIQQILVPISIVLTEEEGSSPPDTGTQTQSTGSNTRSAGSGSDSEYVVNVDIPIDLPESNVVARTPWGEVTREELVDAILSEFLEDSTDTGGGGRRSPETIEDEGGDFDGGDVGTRVGM